MRRLAPGLALSLMLAAAWGAPAVDPGQALLEQVRLWQSLGRPQDAQRALDQLFRIAPVGSPLNAEAMTLQALGQIQQRQDVAAKQTLARLRSLYPKYFGIARVEQMLRLRGADSARLLRARELFQAGKFEEAYAAFNELYQGHPPEGALELEYWQLVSRLPRGGWERSRVELSRMAAEHPANHQIRLALVSIYLLRPPLSQANFAELKLLSKFDDSRGEALAQWRRALLQVDGGLPEANYQDYLVLAPDDQTVRSKIEDINTRQARQRALLADPGYRALLSSTKQLDANQLGAAEQSLRQAGSRYALQGQYLQNLGRLLEKQGRYADAVSVYRRGQAAGSGGNWRGRIEDARLSDALAKADAAMQKQDWAGARAQLDIARQIRPADPDVLIAEGDWQAKQGHAAAARDDYWMALKRKPDSGSVLSGLMAVYLDQGKFDDAKKLLDAMPDKQRKALGESYQTARAQLARAQGDVWLDKGQAEPALPFLREAVRLQPDNVWNRYALANALLATGKGEEGSRLLRELAARPAVDPASLYAYALFQSKRDDNRAVLGALEKVPQTARTPGMADLQRRVWLRETLALADAEAANGQPERARRRLTEAEPLMAGDGPRVVQLADEWQKLGDAAHARELLQAQYLAQPSSDTELAYADLLLGQDEAAAAAPLLDAAQRNRSALSQDQQLTLDGLRGRLAAAQAAQARAAGKAQTASDILQAAAKQLPGDIRIQRAMADDDLQAKRWDAARERALKVLAANPGDDETRLSLMDAYLGAGRAEDARAVAESLLQPVEGGRAPDFTLRVLSRLEGLGDMARVNRELDRMFAAGQSDPGMYQLAAERAQKQDQPDQALSLYRQGLEASAAALSPPSQAAGPDQTGEALAADGPLQPLAAEGGRAESLHSAYAEQYDQRQLKVWQGVDLLYRRPGDGTPGTSQMAMWQAPLLVEIPAKGGGHYFIRADGVDMNAGTLDLNPSNDYTLNRFGTVAACAANSTPQACAAAYGAQHASGLTLGAGYQNDNWRLDVGATSPSFPVSNVIGGVQHSGSLGTLSYTVEASRRPLTSSLLTYAGVHDPYVGENWGGVTATGLGGSLGYDKGGAFGVWSNFAYQQLSGENVESNRKLTAMAGVYWRLIDQPARSVTLGLSTVNFWYQKNLGGFTFGQGGYYSPQRYDSLSIPLRYAARNERWSYFIRGSVSVSSAREDASPFYPTRPDLQALAGNPYYSASSGPGWGASLTGGFEYQYSPTLAWGGLLDIQHSQFYQPSHLVLYLRYQPDGTAMPLAMPVEPLQPYSGF
ncbi:cellulose synthase subunit BcsC-related outer membrane protein [Chromobacterium sp. IIBBL 290-4]|uniref:cellulose synthase subunit BcsC-related outer membrane protein n=1 Tax=Chromobacterium sp. IIBBL 290-4 TaxID=2953890 RepID=UPI0020B6EE69|nr:cellulose synthase subunit BcsC-related outer membrane protein [Chromobacterium sp. IIBBL 290-4]UTH73443.1 cellulose synthase subunit BcsC-related outer membrane protein [Chromobacterium sp. IIBBL 290-4]